MFSRRPYDLKNLMRGGASPRVLDLYGLHKRFPTLGTTDKPLFRHRGLNRCFLIKHNLRRNERSLVRSGRNIVTKLVLPIDPKDPSCGAFWTFIEAPNLTAWLEEALGRDKTLYEEEFDEDFSSRKIEADIFIDDRNIGGLPPWGEIYQMINPNEKPTLEEELKSLAQTRRSIFKKRTAK